MVSTRYFCGGSTLSDHEKNPVVIHGLPADSKKFFFYFESVASCSKSSEDRAAELFGHLGGESFDSYYKEHAVSSELSDAAEDYRTVKNFFISRFGKPETVEEKTQRAVSCSSDASDFPSSLRGIDSLFKTAELGENAKLGSAQKAVTEHPGFFFLVCYV